VDNLTHTLAGALLGQLGLKRQTRLALPALMIGANIPDVDAATVVLGVRSLELRRGLTHGPIALALLPLLLAAALWLYARWRPQREGVPLRVGWLVALCFIGTLSHPLLDALNSYGIRFLEPFSSRWYAADTLFIIDVWIWLALSVCVLLSLRRERRGLATWRKPAWVGAGLIASYIAANGLISHQAETLTHARVQQGLKRTPTQVVANPVPVAFWQRHMLWCDHERHGYGSYSALGRWGHDVAPPSVIPTPPGAAPSSLFAYPAQAHPGDVRDGLWLEPTHAPHHRDDPRVAAFAQADADVRSYLFWSRMPLIHIQGTTLTLTDQRFNNPVVRERFTVRSTLPP
jgi:inner membrane protein